MEKYDVLLVAAALDELSKGSQTGSLDSAQIVIDAFHKIALRGPLIIKQTYTKKGGSTEGYTDLGNVSLDEKDERVTDVRGVQYTRVGKWKIWREIDKKKKNISRIWFVHFLSQGVHEGVRDREFFLEYDSTLSPKGFGYRGEPKQVFHFWIIILYKIPNIVVFGEICAEDDLRVSFNFD